MVQQMQPLLSSTMVSSLFSAAISRSLSMPISPNSFTSTAVLIPSWLAKMWLSRVVLPLPKKPVMIVTGRPCLVSSIAWTGSAAVDMGVL